jgi:hypothetical protein
MKTKKNQNVTNLKNSTGVTNSNCYEIQNLKLWQNSKTQIVTKLKMLRKKTQKLKMGQNSKGFDVMPVS